MRLLLEKPTPLDRLSALSRAAQRGIETALPQAVEQGLRQGVEQGIAALILDNLEEGKSRDQIVAKLQKRFGLGEAQAEEQYENYCAE